MKVEKQFCTPGTKRGLTCLSCYAWYFMDDYLTHSGGIVCIR